MVSYLPPLHTEDIYVPARHGCVHEDVLAGVGCSAGINQQPHPTRTGRLRAAVLAIQASVTMNAKELPNGRLLVPRRAEGPRGEIGEGMVEIGPDDPAFEVWADWLRSRCSDVAQEASDEPDGG